MRLLTLVVGLALVFGVGCGGGAEASDSSDVTAHDPMSVPQSIVDFEDARGWGPHHLEWHTERQWDRLSASDRDWAKNHGWKRATIQEGQKGNGLEFLAMHRAMLRILVGKFPKSKSLFKGWTKVPTNPRDKTSPMPHGQDTEFDPDMAEAIDRLTNHLGDFATDDELGLYIETKARPLPKDPKHRTDDATAGLHNYLHVRFMDPGSAIDIGDPSVNLKNKMFWRLHGWLDARWTAYRKLKGLGEDQPDYKKAIDEATMHLQMNMGGGVKGAPKDPPPESLRQFFETEAESENP